MFGVVSRNFVVARHQFRKRVSGCIQARVFATRTISSFFAMNMPNRLLEVQNSCLGWFLRNFVAARHPFRKRVSGRIQSMSFRHRNHFFVFHNEHAQSTTLGAKLMFGVVSQFRCCTSPILKTGVGVHTKHEFLPPEPFLRFSQRTCPIRYFRSKTHVLGGFTQFRCRTSPISKTGVGVHTKHKFSPPEPFLRFSQRTCPIRYFR
jgi:hypothetical protein